MRHRYTTWVHGTGYLYLAVDFNVKRCWRFRPSLAWLKRNPAYAPVSIGYVLGEDITQRQLDAFIQQGKAYEADFTKECQTPKPSNQTR